MIAHLVEHQLLLRTRQKAARRDAVIFLVLLIVILLFPLLLVMQGGYQPDTDIVVLFAFLALSDAIHIASKLAAYRTLGELIEVLEVLQQALEQEVPVT
jgi:heme/copper-type cytochrome/quinol oxidase subunit 4